ncbi:MAG: hypothetical protein VKK42_29610 [Lyngbya sp.]|nr:hypothetical protein [Lyngbya sp.]
MRWCQEQGFIFDWEPGTAITRVSRQLAGVNPWDGQLVGEVGMAIAAMNPTGQATGYQIKPDKPKKVAKYVWASSSWLGNSILKNQLLPDWVSPLLKVICGDRKHSLRLDGRHLTITSPNPHHEQTVKGFQATFYLDATASSEDLAIAINLKPKDISRELEGLNSELAIAKQLLNFASQFDSLPESNCEAKNC